MITVQLHNLSFHSFHGIHEEERVLGGKYNIDVVVSFQEKTIIDKLDQSIDYAALFAIVKDVMIVPTPMLETIVMKIGQRIKEKFTIIEQINVSIIKVRPPIEGLEGDAK